MGERGHTWDAADQQLWIAREVLMELGNGRPKGGGGRQWRAKKKVPSKSKPSRAPYGARIPRCAQCGWETCAACTVPPASKKKRIKKQKEECNNTKLANKRRRRKREKLRLKISKTTPHRIVNERGRRKSDVDQILGFAAEEKVQMCE